MPRPRKHRRLRHAHQPIVFKPVGLPMQSLDCTILDVEELEALRLADLEGRYQEDAAEQMGVSRSTFQRIVTQARSKVTQALVMRTALQIKDATLRVAIVQWHCDHCGHKWQIEHGSGHGKPQVCPACASHRIRKRHSEGPSHQKQKRRPVS
jgi:predicted DNA-binding protein (UPF0251 family)